MSVPNFLAVTSCGGMAATVFMLCMLVCVIESSGHNMVRDRSSGFWAGKCCSEYNWIRGLLCVMLGAFHYGSNWKPLEQPFKGSARLVSVSLCGLVFPVQCKYIRAKTPLMFLWWFFSNISKCSKWPAEKFISKKQLTEALTSADPATVSGLSLNIWLWLYYVLFRFRRYPRAFLRISCLCWSQLKQ